MGEQFETNIPPPKSWLARNWIWLAGLGCLTPFLLVGGCVVLMVGGLAGVFGMLKSSDVYTQSLAAVTGDPRVVASVGEPIESSFMPQGSFNLRNNDGDANITYKVWGPKGTASVHFIATKTAGVWTYNKHAVYLPGGETIDLRVPAERPPM
jgi:hypothetical protein